MLSETNSIQRVMRSLPLRDLFPPFLCVVGMLIDVPFIIGHWQAVLSFTLLICCLRAVATFRLLPFKLTAHALHCHRFAHRRTQLCAGATRVARVVVEDSLKLILAARVIHHRCDAVVTACGTWCGKRYGAIACAVALLCPTQSSWFPCTGSHAIVVAMVAWTSHCRRLHAAGMPLSSSMRVSPRCEKPLPCIDHLRQRPGVIERFASRIRRTCASGSAPLSIMKSTIAVIRQYAIKRASTDHRTRRTSRP